MRLFIRLSCLLSVLLLSSVPLAAQQDQPDELLMDKIEGLLIGSAIGDAAGGPLEFVYPPLRSKWTTADRVVSKEAISALADSFKLRPYPKAAEPFAQWESYAPAGTITDDTRFKMILFNTLKYHYGRLNRQNFAREVLNFRQRLPEKYQPWFDQWIPEIAYATRWALGERKKAYPPERIWGGIPTMEGQMPFLPIAALYPVNARAAYLKAWELGYFDNGIAKDINSALVAGLVGALQPEADWMTVERYMRETDPYNFNNVLYVPRRMSEWLGLAHGFVKSADGHINRLFDIMERGLQTKTWWEAWVPVVVVFACAEIVDYQPLAAMQLIIEFGHDTDSYAQVMGALMGAIHGKDVFPEDMRRTVNQRLKEQFGQNTDDWMELVGKYGSR